MLKTNKRKINIKDGYKRPKMHKGHYRIYHYYLQKKEIYYDSDCTNYFYKNDGDFIIKNAGIHKDSYRLHDEDGYDDCNNGR